MNNLPGKCDIEDIPLEDWICGSRNIDKLVGSVESFTESTFNKPFHFRGETFPAGIVDILPFRYNKSAKCYHSFLEEALLKKKDSINTTKSLFGLEDAFFVNSDSLFDKDPETLDDSDIENLLLSDPLDAKLEREMNNSLEFSSKPRKCNGSKNLAIPSAEKDKQVISNKIVIGQDWFYVLNSRNYTKLKHTIIDYFVVYPKKTPVDENFLIADSILILLLCNGQVLSIYPEIYLPSYNPLHKSKIIQSWKLGSDANWEFIKNDQLNDAFMLLNRGTAVVKVFKMIDSVEVRLVHTFIIPGTIISYALINDSSLVIQTSNTSSTASYHKIQIHSQGEDDCDIEFNPSFFEHEVTPNDSANPFFSIAFCNDRVLTATDRTIKLLSFSEDTPGQLTDITLPIIFKTNIKSFLNGRPILNSLKEKGKSLYGQHKECALFNTFSGEVGMIFIKYDDTLHPYLLLGCQISDKLCLHSGFQEHDVYDILANNEFEIRKIEFNFDRLTYIEEEIDRTDQRDLQNSSDGLRESTSIFCCSPFLLDDSLFSSNFNLKESAGHLITVTSQRIIETPKYNFIPFRNIEQCSPFFPDFVDFNKIEILYDNAIIEENILWASDGNCRNKCYTIDRLEDGQLSFTEIEDILDDKNQVLLLLDIQDNYILQLLNNGLKLEYPGVEAQCKFYFKFPSIIVNFHSHGHYLLFWSETTLWFINNTYDRDMKPVEIPTEFLLGMNLSDMNLCLITEKTSTALPQRVLIYLNDRSYDLSWEDFIKGNSLLINANENTDLRCFQDVFFLTDFIIFVNRNEAFIDFSIRTYDGKIYKNNFKSPTVDIGVAVQYKPISANLFTVLTNEKAFLVWGTAQHEAYMEEIILPYFGRNVYLCDVSFDDKENILYILLTHGLVSYRLKNLSWSSVKYLTEDTQSIMKFPLHIKKLNRTLLIESRGKSFLWKAIKVENGSSLLLDTSAFEKSNILAMFEVKPIDDSPAVLVLFYNLVKLLALVPNGGEIEVVEIDCVCFEKILCDPSVNSLDRNKVSVDNENYTITINTSQPQTMEFLKISTTNQKIKLHSYIFPKALFSFDDFLMFENSIVFYSDYGNLFMIQNIDEIDTQSRNEVITHFVLLNKYKNSLSENKSSKGYLIRLRGTLFAIVNDKNCLVLDDTHNVKIFDVRNTKLCVDPDFKLLSEEDWQGEIGKKFYGRDKTHSKGFPEEVDSSKSRNFKELRSEKESRVEDVANFKSNKANTDVHLSEIIKLYNLSGKSDYLDRDDVAKGKEVRQNDKGFYNDNINSYLSEIVFNHEVRVVTYRENDLILKQKFDSGTYILSLCECKTPHHENEGLIDLRCHATELRFFLDNINSSTAGLEEENYINPRKRTREVDL